MPGGRPCLDVLRCSLVGFNFTYLTLAMAALGASVARKMSEEPIRYSLYLLSRAAEQQRGGPSWHRPFTLYFYASFLPLAVSLLVVPLALLWAAVLRPALSARGPCWCSGQVVNMVLVLLMVAYTGALVPGPVCGLRLAAQLRDADALHLLKDQLAWTFSHTRYYSTNRSALSPAVHHSTLFGSAMDNLQRHFRCCGFNGVQDYSRHHTGPFPFSHGIPFPYSCCVVARLTPPQWARCAEKHPKYFNNMSCSRPVLQQVEEALDILNGAGCSAVVIGVIAVVLSVTFTLMRGDAPADF